ncbi:MAG: zf-HC2 domain-containing protein [Gemmatimonadales bacterium]|nr:zf-HC2 domain-containing protein [Gemmatimonadales bacterium]
MSDEFTNLLSPYLDGELDDLARGRLEAHLDGCLVCRTALTELRAIVAAAPHYEGREPSRDLWAAIDARLGEPDVVPIGQGAAPGRTGRQYSMPALLAASLAALLVGAGGAWVALRPAAGDAAAPMAVQPAEPPVSGAPEVKNVALAEARYDAAIRDLELLLQAGRTRLDTLTVRTVEESLRKIDAAISEARTAVQRDPSNAYLSRQIAANMRRKLNLLRTATNAISART